jgi:TPR repeat protein
MKKKYITLFLPWVFAPVSMAQSYWQTPAFSTPNWPFQVQTASTFERTYQSHSYFQLQSSYHSNPQAQHVVSSTFARSRRSYITPRRDTRRHQIDYNDAVVQFERANAFYYGRGQQKDEVKAALWYERAAQQEHILAQRKLGFIYEHGIGVTQDYQQAMYWYKAAACQWDDNAQYKVGWLFMEGLGVQQSYSLARHWFMQAAAQGETNAQYHLGWLYEHGHGTESDQEEAIYWYEQAAEQGFQPAIDRLDIIWSF